MSPTANCHAAYFASWLKVLRNEKRFIFSAAAHAQRGVDFLHRLQPEADETIRVSCEAT
jgi:antirestriction protein ArdC